MKKYLKMIGFLLVYYGLPMAVSLGCVFTIFRVEPFKSWPKICPSIYYAVIDPVIIVLLFLFFKVIRKKSMGQYCKFIKTAPANLILGLLTGFFMGMFTYSLINIDYVKNHFPALVGSVKYFLLGGNIVALLGVVAVNSFSKEIQFRGLMFNELRDNMPVVLAVIIQALLYASQVALGSPWELIVYAFIGSVMFGIIYYVGKSIWVSIMSQIGCTLGMVLLDRTSLSKIFTVKSSFSLFILSIVLVMVLIVITQRKNTPASDQKAVSTNA